jgi:hypothetical protein
MPLGFAGELPQCRLLLRKSGLSFAERKTTQGKSSAIGRWCVDGGFHDVNLSGQFVRSV